MKLHSSGLEWTKIDKIDRLTPI